MRGVCNVRKLQIEYKKFQKENFLFSIFPQVRGLEHASLVKLGYVDTRFWARIHRSPHLAVSSSLCPEEHTTYPWLTFGTKFVKVIVS